MGKIAWGRVLLGGVVAGIVFNVFEFVLHGVILGRAWESAMMALGKTKEQMEAAQASSMTLLVLWAFLATFFGTWLYAAIRPRYGAGPKTGFAAGLWTWFALSFLSGLVSIAFSLYPTSLMFTAMAGELVGLVACVLIGAWLYKEA